MKVLIETITNRKGYKNFNNINGLHEFLKQNHKKIKNYKIINETYNGTFEDLIREIMEKADLISNMLLYSYFNMTDKNNKYNNILKAAGLAEECEVLENKLFYIFRQQEKLKKAKHYEALIYAAGRVYEAYGAIRRCIK